VTPSCSFSLVRRVRRAFSLVEVVVAVGIFAIAIVSIIGLMVPIQTSVAEVSNTEDAGRLATVMQERLQAEVLRLQKANAGTYWADFAGYLTGGTALYASRDASKLGRYSDASWGASNLEKFYKIELTRNQILSPSGTANDDAAGFLAFTIKLTWPAYLSDTSSSLAETNPQTRPASPAQQSILLLPAAVTR
jgi:type II secretory pathway pseudopilin PulG